MNVEPVSTTIQVDMEVERYDILPEDNLVQVWGYVGDYNVSVWLPLDDPRAWQVIRRQEQEGRRQQA